MNFSIIYFFNNFYNLDKYLNKHLSIYFLLLPYYLSKNSKKFIIWWAPLSGRCGDEVVHYSLYLSRMSKSQCPLPRYFGLSTQRKQIPHGSAHEQPLVVPKGGLKRNKPRAPHTAPFFYYYGGHVKSTLLCICGPPLLADQLMR